MSSYTKKNLKDDVENQAPKFGMPAELEARFARTALGGETLGVSHMKLAPNFRIPFGHKHAGQEEVYVVVRGSARIKVEDEIVELCEWDASTRTRCAPSRRGLKASSTSPSAPATIPETPRWRRAGGATTRGLKPVAAMDLT
ncbi:MAG: hypothetical protein H0T97_02825 [Actinobacteria bacterium]|nr:hypothetical protein [Actinomycetota bacterium]